MNLKSIFIALAMAPAFMMGAGTLSSMDIYSGLPPGYPEKCNINDLKVKFKSPPKGYGEVPFYWWIGDTLTREHIVWELDQLAGKKISSLQINYCHQDHGGQIYGLTYPSQPALFSDEWWSLFGWFMDEAGKRGMTVSLSDYTLGPGQGSYVDAMLAENPDLNGYELRFDSLAIKSGVPVIRDYSAGIPVSLNEYTDGNTSRSLLPLIRNGKLDYIPVSDGMITEIRAERKVPSMNPMNPEIGKSYVRHFFQMFEDHFPGRAQNGLNFFFSDELNLNLDGNIWDERFAGEFRRQKGYDILPYIDALYIDIGDITPKIRLDYNDVRVTLSEKYFFKPLYDWHQDRGLLFGCDHGGRGRDVSEFGDYFRTQRWNQAPGCDQPYLQHDIVKNKVASSICHLYERQRVWLEGFHSSGWGTNSAQLTDAIFSNFVMGHNLLSLHGLYYTTKGGRWEWAPPCNHFHEPYWSDMKPLLDCSERLSYLLSQGYHAADVAILYPVEPVVAGYGDNAVNVAFDLGTAIYNHGVDFDYMDYESLDRAVVKDGRLNVAGESFGVLVVPSMEAIKFASLKKIVEFAKNGGIVVNVGVIPEATDNAGRGDKKVQRLLKEIFDSQIPNVVRFDSIGQASEFICSHDRDFEVIGDDAVVPYIMHRKLDNRELYAVYNVPKGTICSFRSVGGVELWNPYTGEICAQEVAAQADGRTKIVMPLDSTDIHIFVFDHSTVAQINPDNADSLTVRVVPLDSEWDFELEPVLDNSYGDYHWPATSEKLGAFIYDAAYSQIDMNGNVLRSKDNVTFGFGEKFICTRTDSSRSVAEPYAYSWRWGVEGDCGRQGWHGLKGEIYEDFIRLGKIERAFNGMQRVSENAGYTLSTFTAVPNGKYYPIEWGDIRPDLFKVNGLVCVAGDSVYLKEGINEILLHYPDFCTTRFVVRDGGRRVVHGFEDEMPLTTSYRGDMSILPFDTRKIADTSARFTKTLFPGVNAVEITAFAEPEVYIDEAKCNVSMISSRADGAGKYRVVLPYVANAGSVMTINVHEPFGYQGGAVIDGPVKCFSTSGKWVPCDWSGNDVLATYSGAAIYSTSFDLADNAMGSIILDLGDVVSSADVTVNGVHVGTRLTSPWQFDITTAVSPGVNRLSVRVCNTAANFYLKLPSFYKGDIKSGLIGPVNLLIQ